MRTTPEENSQMGRIFAEKLNRSAGPVAVLIPLRGFSQLDLEGQPFHWPDANQAFIQTLTENLRAGIPVTEIDTDINDPIFSDKAADTLLAMLRK
jgi:uncharacterized protein (UPF0261 family)